MQKCKGNMRNSIFSQPTFILPKLTRRGYGVFIVNFELISYILLVFKLFALNKSMSAEFLGKQQVTGLFSEQPFSQTLLGGLSISSYLRLCFMSICVIVCCKKAVRKDLHKIHMRKLSMKSLFTEYYRP